MDQASAAHQGALAEQRSDQVHGHLSRSVTHVQRGIEFHDVERGEPARVRDHFHAKLRLTIGRAARHGGQHSGRNVRVEEVHVEADVQVRVAVESQQ